MVGEKRYSKAPSVIVKRHKIRRYAGIFLKISLPTAFVIGAIFLLRANFLQVKNFEVVGAETLQPEVIKNVALGVASGTRLFLIPKSNIILLDKGELAAALISQFPRLEKVDVNKQLFGESIKLSLTERKADFLWCSSQNECFSMTKDGLVFERAENPGDKIIFTGILEGDPLMKNFADQERMKNYSKMIEIFGNAGFEISSINIESNDKMTTKTSIGDMIFSPGETDFSTAVQNTILLISEMINKKSSVRFQYIDARFGNKIFYKTY